MSDPNLIGTTAAAKVLDAAERSVKRWAKTGKLPIAFKMPGATGAYLFRRSDVEAFRDARTPPVEEVA